MRDALFLLLLWIVVGAVVFSFLEGWPFIDALYFAVISITTVGYGDIVPTTTAGKLFTVAFLLVGVGLALYVINTITERVLGVYKKTERLVKRLSQREKELERRERELEKREAALEEKERKLEERVKRLERALEERDEG